MKKFQEVEKRIILSDQERDRIFKDLEKIGAVYRGVQKIEDSYFCKSEYKNFRQTAMKEVGSYGLRIRNISKKGSNRNQLNIKVITEEDNHHSWEEHEVDIDDISEMTAILKAIGQKLFYKFKKKRHTFEIEGLEVLVEDIEDFGPIIEIEGKTTFDKSHQMQEKIIDLLKRLNLDKDKIVPKSVTYILMEKYSKF